MNSTAEQAARLAKLSAAAASRQAAADAIARCLGYSNSNAAFREMGQPFLALIKKHAPSINAAMKP